MVEDKISLFCFGSRSVTVIPKLVTNYLDTHARQAVTIFLGDANGADKAFQKYFLINSFQNVVVFTSLSEPRNNFGNWPVSYVASKKGAKGHEIHQLKDIEAASKSDAGLALWDGESVGTLLSALLILLKGGTVKIWLHDGSGRFEGFGDTDSFYKFVENVSSETLAKLIARFSKLSTTETNSQQGQLF